MTVIYPGTEVTTMRPEVLLTRHTQKIQAARRRQRHYLMLAILTTGLAAILAVWFALVNQGTLSQEPVSQRSGKQFEQQLLQSEIVVREGDTLWTIARRTWPHEDPRKGVWRLRKANPGVEPGKLRAGTVIVSYGGRNWHDDRS